MISAIRVLCPNHFCTKKDNDTIPEASGIGARKHNNNRVQTSGGKASDATVATDTNRSNNSLCLHYQSQTSKSDAKVWFDRWLRRAGRGQSAFLTGVSVNIHMIP